MTPWNLDSMLLFPFRRPPQRIPEYVVGRGPRDTYITAPNAWGQHYDYGDFYSGLVFNPGGFLIHTYLFVLAGTIGRAWEVSLKSPAANFGKPPEHPEYN